jgi:hypothetical protein
MIVAVCLLQDKKVIRAKASTYRYFMRSLAKAILASSNANRTPRQQRGPAPKGIHAMGCLFFFNSGSNLYVKTK